MNDRGPQPVLHTTTEHDEKITLRPARAEDIDGIFAACTDPESQRWTTIPREYGRDKAESWVNEYAPGWWERGDGACWVITDSDDNYAAQLDLRILAGDRAVADVGFLTAPHARGRGYMAAALRAAAEFGLRELGLARVEWKAHVGNHASRRVAEKAGFHFEGTQRLGCSDGEKRVDSWVAALIQEDLA